MKPITKAIKSAYCKQKNWKKEIYIFLLNYRSTSHCSTGYSPAGLLFNRKINKQLPQQAPDLSNSRIHSQVVENDAKAKAVMNRYADTTNRSKKTAKTEQILNSFQPYEISSYCEKQNNDNIRELERRYYYTK